jgi:hypothetical protein
VDSWRQPCRTSAAAAATATKIDRGPGYHMLSERMDMGPHLVQYF